jgi:hypothetical protein
MAKKKGRPAGTRNAEFTVVPNILAACPSCQSTERESVRIVIERHIPGISPAGKPRTHIVWRRVRCKNCKRYYIEQEHQNRIEPEEIANSEERIEILDSCSCPDIAAASETA